MDAKRLTRNVGWLWVGYAGRSLGYLLLIVVLTRGLGTGGFGVLSLFLAVTLGVSQVAGSWPFLAVPVLSAREGSIGAAFRPAAYVAAMATAASLVIAIPVCIALGIGSAASIATVVVSGVALVGLQGVYAVQQTEGRMGEIALFQTLERVIALVIALVAVAVTTLGVLGTQALLTVASAVTFVIAIGLVDRRRHLFRSDEGMPDHLVGTVMGAVGAMGIVSLASYGVAYADIFVLAIFRADSDVGLYSLAYQLFSSVTALTAFWLIAALPEHARSTASGQDLREQLPIGRMVKFTGLWAALLGVGGVVAAFVLPLLFGKSFEEATVPLLLLLGGSGVLAAVYSPPHGADRGRTEPPDRARGDRLGGDEHRPRPDPGADRRRHRPRLRHLRTDPGGGADPRLDRPRPRADPPPHRGGRARDRDDDAPRDRTEEHPSRRPVPPHRPGHRGLGMALPRRRGRAPAGHRRAADRRAAAGGGSRLSGGPGTL